MEGRCFCGSVFFLINERTPWSWGLAGQGFVGGNY